MSAEDAGTVAVEVVWSPAPREWCSVALILPAGATVGDAARAAGAPAPADAAPAWTAAVWGRSCAPAQPLRDGDRVELLRPLQAAPMDARRVRYRNAGGAAALRARQAKPPPRG